MSCLPTAITTTTTIDSDVIELGTESSTTTMWKSYQLNAIQVQVINTTSGDVVSTIDPNAATRQLFYSPTANQTEYVLPTNCPIGFIND